MRKIISYFCSSVKDTFFITAQSSRDLPGYYNNINEKAVERYVPLHTLSVLKNETTIVSF